MLDSASEFGYLHLRLLSTDDQTSTLSVSVTVGGVTSTVSFTRSASLVDGKYEYYAYIAFPDADAAYEGTVGLAYSETTTTTTTVDETRADGKPDPGGKTESLLLSGTYSDEISRTLYLKNGSSYTFSWTVYDTSGTPGVKTFSETITPTSATSNSLASVVTTLNAKSANDQATWAVDGSNLKLTHTTKANINDAEFDASLVISTTTTAAQTGSVVIDTLAPEVSSVAITAQTGAQSNFLNAGDTVTATVTMSQAVVLNLTGGTPTLALNIGGTTVSASYDATASTSTLLRFKYTILATQNDTNGISIDANGISLNSATIKDANGNNAILTFTAVGDNATYKVDNLAPDPPSVALNAGVTSGGATADECTNLGTVTGEAGGTLEVRYTDSNGPTVFTQTFSNYDGTAKTLALGNLGPQSNRMNDGEIKIEVLQTDAAGNIGVWTEAGRFTLDTVAPLAPTVDLGTGVIGGATEAEAIQASGVVTVNSAVGNTVTVTFSGQNGSVTKEVAGTGAAAAVTLALGDLAPLGQGQVSVSAIAHDAAGNNSNPSATSFLLDTIAPVDAEDVTSLVRMDMKFQGNCEDNIAKAKVVFCQNDNLVWDSGYLESSGGQKVLDLESGTFSILLPKTQTVGDVTTPLFGDDNGGEASTYDVKVISEDAAGNVTETAVSVEVDALAPPIPSVQDFSFVTDGNKWRHDVGALGYLAPAIVTTDPTATVEAWVQAGNQELIVQRAIYDPTLRGGSGAFSLTPTLEPNADQETNPGGPTVSLSTHYGALKLVMAAKDQAGNILNKSGNPAVVSLLYGANAAAPVSAVMAITNGIADIPDADPTDGFDTSVPGSPEVISFNFSTTTLVSGALYELVVGTTRLTGVVGQIATQPAPTLAQLVAALQADPDYEVTDVGGTTKVAPFTLSEDGTNLIVTWDTNGDQNVAASFRSSIDDVLIGENTFTQGGTSTPIDDMIVGYAGNDRIEGQAGNDYLFGGSDSDTVLGGIGRDYIAGGTQKDYLTGGDGNDRFVYSRVNESSSSASARDVITDFTAKALYGGNDANADTIDLSEISKSLLLTLTFKSAFTFGATGKAGSLKAVKGDVWLGNDGVLYANTGGNEAAELGIQLNPGGFADLATLRTAFSAGNGLVLA